MGLFLGGGEYFTKAFQLLPRRHLSLHHNGKGSLATETGAVNTSDVVINHTNHLHHSQVLPLVSINKQQLGRLQASVAGGALTRNRRDLRGLSPAF